MQGFFWFISTGLATRHNLLLAALSQRLAPSLDDENDMNKFLALIAVLALTGCATSENTYLKNGEQGLSIDCSGEANNWAACYQKADDSCAGTGYRIVSTNGTPATKESDKTLGVDVGNFKNRSVVVVCK